MPYVLEEQRNTMDSQAVKPPARVQTDILACKVRARMKIATRCSRSVQWLSTCHSYFITNSLSVALRIWSSFLLTLVPFDPYAGSSFLQAIHRASRKWKCMQPDDFPFQTDLREFRYVLQIKPRWKPWFQFRVTIFQGIVIRFPLPS